MKSHKTVKKNFYSIESFKLSYPQHDGMPNPFWIGFFVKPPLPCAKILSAESTLKSEDLIDSAWNRYVSKKRFFYNTFLCEEGVAHYVYDKSAQTLTELIIAFNDDEFTKILPKKPYRFYSISLERFLEKAKRRLENDGRVILFFDEYKIVISKKYFSVEENGKTIVENFIDEVVYNDLNEVVVNPYTELSVHLYAPKTLYDFFQFYLGIRDKKLTRKEVKVSKRGGFLIDMGHRLVYIVVLFGLLVLMWIVDARLSDDISPVRMAVEGFAALAVAEVVYGILKSKAM